MLTQTKNSGSSMIIPTAALVAKLLLPDTYRVTTCSNVKAEMVQIVLATNFYSHHFFGENTIFLPTHHWSHVKKNDTNLITTASSKTIFGTMKII